MGGRIALRPVFHVIGILLTILGLGMLVPALADVAVGNPDWTTFVGASAATLGVSGGMVLATASDEPQPFTIKQHFLLTALAWTILALFGALPFMLSALRLSFTDAYFEAMSGLTTGATVIVGLDQAPPGILLWRSLLNWFGGIGIIVMAIAVLPILRVGGMQLFRMESSDKSDKPFATVQDTVGAIALTYLALTLLSTVAFHHAGMGWFDAVNHAMSAVSTGGFSTKDASLAWFDSQAVLWVATASMIAGAVPLTWYIRSLRGTRRRPLLGDSQVNTLLLILALCSAAMTAWAYWVVGLPFWDAFGHATMNVTSIITDTGLVSADYSTWGSFPIVAFFFFYFIGGCTGSTSGSIKIFRWQVLALSMLNQMRRMLKPHRVLVPLYQGKPLDEDVIGSVINFAFAYMMAFGILALVVAAMGIDFLTAASAVASTLAGAGPGLGPVIGPSGSYQPLPDAAKWVLSFTMLLGRLEVFTVLVLFLPSFWRD